MHPYNNGMWMYLANCIDDDQTTDLDEIKFRQQKRMEIREELKPKEPELKEKKEEKKNK